jgi:hypothetical protein
MKNRVFSGLAALGIAGSACAQPIVDIVLAENGNSQIEVRLRPHGPFDGVISNVVFTLRWQEQLSPALSMVGLVHPQSEYLPIAASAIVNGGNGYQYRTFSAVSFAPMNDFGYAWEGGIEYPVCTLDVLAPGAEVAIVNDEFTQAFNRNYFVSLNGLPRTGAIYQSVIPPVHAMALNNGNGFIDVLLTPDADYFGWVNSIDFTLRWPANGASLGAIEQPQPIGAALPISKAGAEVESGGYIYQRFNGAGSMSLGTAQCGWTANEDHVILRMPITGSVADATVADDAWTTANNGAYSILLNGTPSAGGTDESFASTGPQFHEIIPQMQIVGEELRVHTTANGQGSLVLTVLSANGQPVAQRRAKWGVIERFSLAGWASGMYVLKANFEQGQVARRFVY